MFGWASLKTTFSASDKEIEELTGTGPMSEETRKKFEDRINMNPALIVFIFITSGPLLGATGWLLSLSWLFWVGVVLCVITLFMNMASGAMKLPILPVAFMAGAAAFFSPWYVGIGAGLLIWTALESVGHVVGLKREGRL